MSTDDSGRGDALRQIDDIPSEPSVNNEPGTSKSWNRRTFLKAAALGTAAAALAGKAPGGSFRLGGFTASASDLSTSPCTAQDVTVAPEAFVTNEPCTCSGTFNATVQFTVTNNTGSARYCVTLYIPSGFGVPEQNVLLGDIPANTTQTMTGTVTGFPCNTNGTEVCFGSPGTDGRRKCDPGTCLTVGWNTSAQATCINPSPPGGQCRHQRICVQGFGIKAECADGTCTTRSLTNSCCTVSCGDSLNVKITANGSSAPACTTPLTISVKRPGESSFTNVTLNSSGCYVDSSPVAGTYTFRATDCHGCFREATLAVCVATITAHLAVSGNTACNSGVLTFTGSVTGCTGTPTFEFSVDGTVMQAASTTTTFTYNPSLVSGGLDTGCHTVSVLADCSSCTDITSRTVSQCVTSTVGAEDTTCPTT